MIYSCYISNVPPFVIPLVLIGILFIIIGIGMTVYYFKNVKQKFQYSFNKHTIEVVTSFTFCSLSVDGQVVDKLKSYGTRTASLSATVDGVLIKSQIGSGMAKPIVLTYIDGKHIENGENLFKRK